MFTRGGAIPNNNRVGLGIKAAASRPVKGHMAYIINPAQNRRKCKGPVNLNRDQYKHFYALPENSKHKWVRRKEQALQRGDHKVVWESLTNEGRRIGNPWKTKKGLKHKMYHKGAGLQHENYQHIHESSLNHNYRLL